MRPTYFAQYLGFEFQCSPRRFGSNAFAPRLVVSNPAEATEVELLTGASGNLCEDATAAAHQAFAHGRDWVDSGFWFGGSNIVPLLEG